MESNSIMGNWENIQYSNKHGMDHSQMKWEDYAKEWEHELIV